MHGKVSDFPHRCNQCREAVSVDLLADPICCPKCGGNDIVSYAAKTKCASPWMLRLISNHWLAKLGYHTPAEEQHGDYCYPLDRHSAILWGKHPCPKCNAQGLQFSVRSKIASNSNTAQRRNTFGFGWLLIQPKLGSFTTSQGPCRAGRGNNLGLLSLLTLAS